MAEITPCSDNVIKLIKLIFWQYFVLYVTMQWGGKSLYKDLNQRNRQKRIL
jgi:hypothetical protein